MTILRYRHYFICTSQFSQLCKNINMFRNVLQMKNKLFGCCTHPGREARETRKLSFRFGPWNMSWTIKQDRENRKGSWIVGGCLWSGCDWWCSCPAEEAAMLHDITWLMPWDNHASVYSIVDFRNEPLNSSTVYVS